MEKWNTYFLKDIATFSQGIQVDINNQFIKKDKGLIRFIRIIDYSKNNEPPRYISCPKNSYIVNADDIVMIRYGSQTAGKVVRGISGAIANNMFKITLNNNIITNEYAYYYLLQTSVFNNLRGSQSSSTMPAITFELVGRQKILLPNIHIQKKITTILSSLDKKIELNRCINENLEQQAQALFKSWFVDFEPFKDGKFVDSELGMIPEGWKVGIFKDIIHSTLSGDWGKECKQGNHTQKVFCIRGADIPNIKRGDKGNMPTRFIIEKNFQSKALMDGDMVIEVSGGSPTQATGRACRISRGLLDKYNHSIVCTNFCRAIKPLSQYSSFLYYMWEMFYNQGIMFSYENGTTGIKNLDINGLIQKEPIIIPPVEIALEFEKITQIYYEKIQSNGVESEKLSQLRDTLLPRLMSGELKISDIDNKNL